ncbi:Cytochrome P450 monooxygenase [Lachnellula willkommii]|uniref:Cytochrome P450 monooxygenase n=1 Tax=Lachnellula willkommii TaxID=215461 RepID=A0A559MAC6_9HELO|nr:Cytochrome P450 monooxygenase [Lachnellula willkommii]
MAAFPLIGEHIALLILVAIAGAIFVIRFPGPKLASISDLWTVWYSIKGQSHLKAYDVHREYEIYHGSSTLKSNVYETITPAPGAFSTFTAIDRHMHQRKRKVFSQAFSESAISAFEPTIRRHCEIFITELAKAIPSVSGGRWSQPLNMTPRTRHYATDVMGDFGFGRSFDMQTSTRNHFLMKATDGATLVAGIYCQYPKLKDYGMGRLVALLGVATKERFGRLAKMLIDERLSDDTENRRDLLHFISKGDKKTREPFSMNEVWAESRFTLIAGAETTATAISSILFYLSRNPASLTRLTSLIRTTYPSRDDIQLGPKLTQCTYLWASIDEAMRLSPSVVAILWRQVIAENFTIDGEHVPAGCDLGFSSYVPHHDASIFIDPYAFKPERWLASSNPEDQSRLEMQQRAFTPFGLGPRKCIGMRMAYAEVALCLAKTLWALDLRRAKDGVGRIGAGRKGAKDGREKEEEFQLFEHITCRHDGPYLEWAWRSDKAI